MTKVSPSCYNLRKLRTELANVWKKVQACPTFNPLLFQAQLAFSKFESSLIAKAGLTPSPYDILTIEPSVPADSVIVMLHGGFQSVFDIITYTLGLQEILPSTRFVLPQAPSRFLKILNTTGPLWFDSVPEGPEDVEGILKSADSIRDIANIQRQVYGMNKVGIIGISQGGAVAMTTYLRHKWDVAVGLVTYTPLLSTYPAELTNLSKNAKALIVHGTEDEAVPFERALQSVAALESFGRIARLVSYDGEEHGLWNVVPNALKKVGAFCKKSFYRL